MQVAERFFIIWNWGFQSTKKLINSLYVMESDSVPSPAPAHCNKGSLLFFRWASCLIFMTQHFKYNRRIRKFLISSGGVPGYSARLCVSRFS